MSDEATRPSASGSTSAGASPQQSAAAEARQDRVRRIAYFMLFRLAILAAFTVMVGVVFYARGDSYGRDYLFFAWGSLVTGYALTIWWARRLSFVADLERFAALQTAADILLTGDRRSHDWRRRLRLRDALPHRGFLGRRRWAGGA